MLEDMSTGPLYHGQRPVRGTEMHVLTYQHRICLAERSFCPTQLDKYTFQSGMR